MVDHTMDEAVAATMAAAAGGDSIIAYTGSLKQQLDAALSGVTLPAGVQEKINTIFDVDTATAAKIAAAVPAAADTTGGTVVGRHR
jgi:hypothetical protein